MKRRIAYNHLLLALLSVIIIFAGCSTQKDRFVNRAYHIINAKYNGYFNARESYREALQNLEDAHKDNYESILEIFKYGTEDDLAAIESNMDVAYKKSSVVIQRHSMNIRGVEHNTMIDDAYFLIARSHFFKQDYNLAILTFEYIIRQFDTPLKYESKIWIAKTNNFMGRFDNAKQVLQILQNNYNEGVLPEDSHRLFYLVYADHYYKQGLYDEAIPYMKKAVEETGRRNNRTRLVFILGQTYQETGDYANAQKAYARVLRLNPDFDMEFRARINMAMAYDPEIGGGTQIREQLERMLRQDRNRNYRDQIYYALAKLSENQNQKDEAIDYYMKSTQVSDGNDIQKGLSFLRLGEIYFDKEEFYKAHNYYDSTVTFLPGTYEGIEEIQEKHDILSDLAVNIKIINREDSLQRIASLPTAERNRIIDEIIEKEREVERQERERERNMMLAGGSGGREESLRGAGGDRQGGWYFYNPSAISFGESEFASRWGERKLEDLWRISNKQTFAFDDGMQMDVPDDFVESEAFGDGYSDMFSRETYLNNLPLLPEQLEESNEKIIQAYYNKGLIFRDRLGNKKKSVEAFETLNNRFPGNDHTLYTYYFLYDIFEKNGNDFRANTYKNKIIEEFPNSDFAKILSDPDYAQTLLERQNRGKQLYSLSYQAFINKNYEEALEYTKAADTLDLHKELAGRFAYIKALSHGALGHERNFREGLNVVVNNYEGEAVYEPAKNLIASLSEGGYSLADAKVRDRGTDRGEEGESKKDETETPETVEFHSKYDYKPEAIHFFVFVVNTDEIEIRQLRNIVNSFNREAYPDRNLTLSNVYLEDGKQILTVTNFENKQNAIEYLNKVVNSDELSNVNIKHLQAFTISVENYPEFYREKDLKGYLEFYEHYYK